MEDEISRALKGVNHKDRLLVLKMMGVKPEHLKIGARDLHPEVREKALAHHLADKTVFDSVLDDPYGQAIEHILTQYPDKINGDWITRAWNHPSVDRAAIAPLIANLPNTPNAVKMEVASVPVAKSISLKDLESLKEPECDDEEVDVESNPVDVYLNHIRPEHAKL